MTKVIESLTPEQEAKIQVYLDEGLRLGLGTERISLEEVTPLVEDVYRTILDREAPRVELLDSPKAGMKRVNELLGQPKDTYVSNYITGCQTLHWVQFYRFINNELPVDKFMQDKLECYFRLVSRTGWIYPYDEVCVVTQKPTELHFNAEKRLHNTKGPAIAYADGYSLYALNGVKMDGCEALMKPGTRGKDILDVKNVEQRAELIKLHGIQNLFNDLNPELLDSARGYELYKITIYKDDSRVQPRIYLKMNNPSVDEVHVEAVHPDCATVDQALSWRNFGTYDIGKGAFVAPLVLT